MSYIGTEPKDIRSFGRTKFDYTASQGQTAFTGADDDGKVLAFTVGQIEVYVNGILMDDSDFTTTGTGTVTLASAANLNDVINIVSFESNIPDNDYVPASGGTFTGNVTHSGTVTNSGNVTVGGTLGVTGATTMTGDLTVDTNTLHVDVADNRVGVGLTAPAQPLHVFKASSSGDGLVPLIKVQNDTNNTTGDGSGIEFHGKYQGGEWGFGKIGGTNSGSNFGGALEFHTNTGTGSVSTGFTKKMTIDRTGAVTKPYQPSFKAHGTINAYSTTTPVVFDSISQRGGHNIGNHYNTSTGVFTAPFAGRYLFHAHFGITRVTSATGSCYPNLTKNGASIMYTYVNMPTATSYVNAHLTQIVDLAANDTVGVTFSNNNASYYNGHGELAFAGCLLG